MGAAKRRGTFEERQANPIGKCGNHRGVVRNFRFYNSTEHGQILKVDGQYMSKTKTKEKRNEG